MLDNSLSILKLVIYAQQMVSFVNKSSEIAMEVKTFGKTEGCRKDYQKKKGKKLLGEEIELYEP